MPLGCASIAATGTPPLRLERPRFALRQIGRDAVQDIQHMGLDDAVDVVVDATWRRATLQASDYSCDFFELPLRYI